MHNGFEMAIEAAGGQSALAAALGVARQQVHYWRAAGLPLKHLRAVEAATGVPRHVLAPALFKGYRRVKGA